MGLVRTKENHPQRQNERRICLMDDHEIDLEPEEYAARMSQVLRKVAPKYGCLAIIGDKNRVISKGTVCFVRSGSNHLLVTAKHVVDGLFEHSDRLSLIKAISHEGPSIPKTFFVMKSALCWSSDKLDVAILRAPDDLRTDSGVEWFDLNNGKRMIGILREKWQRAGAPYLLLGVGFPNFGHLGGQLTNGQWVEVLGMLTIPAIISLLKSKPDGSSPMYLEVTATDPMPPSVKNPISQGIFNAIKDNPPSESIDMGGLSGGPLLLFDQSGYSEMVGVINQGSIMDVAEEGSSVANGNAKARMLVATPVDELTELGWLKS